MVVYWPYLAFVCLAVLLAGNAQARDVSPMEYLVWPRINITRQDAKSIETFLKSVASNQTQLYASEIPPGSIPSFWLAVLDDESSQIVSRHADVSVKAGSVYVVDFIADFNH